ncbi:hypothetical protein [Variovorax sp. UC122_21]|uniref:hypothetical protein n=1 Tax=Variovorax sp. UC122_21 TaxID=3374554 RepID=UPI003757BA9C
MPDAALDMRRLDQHELQQHAQQVDLGPRRRGRGDRLGVARRDRAAGLLGGGAPGRHLGARAAAVEREHHDRERRAHAEQQHPEEDQLTAQRFHLPRSCPVFGARRVSRERVLAARA